MANSVDTDQTAPIGAVCSGSRLFASILNLSVMLSNYLQQTVLADDIFQMHFFLGALRVKLPCFLGSQSSVCQIVTCLEANSNMIRNRGKTKKYIVLQMNGS